MSREILNMAQKVASSNHDANQRVHKQHESLMAQISALKGALQVFVFQLAAINLALAPHPPSCGRAWRRTRGSSRRRWRCCGPASAPSRRSESSGAAGAPRAPRHGLQLSLAVQKKVRGFPQRAGPGSRGSPSKGPPAMEGAANIS